MPTPTAVPEPAAEAAAEHSPGTRKRLAKNVANATRRVERRTTVDPETQLSLQYLSKNKGTHREKMRAYKARGDPPLAWKGDCGPTKKDDWLQGGYVDKATYCAHLDDIYGEAHLAQFGAAHPDQDANAAAGATLSRDRHRAPRSPAGPVVAAARALQMRD